MTLGRLQHSWLPLLAVTALVALAGGCSTPAASTVTPSVTAATPAATPAATTSAPRPTGVGPLDSVELTWSEGVDPGAASGQHLNVPAGWSARVWANIPGARLAAWTPDGRLVVSTGKQDTIVLVTPTSAHEAPTVTTLLDGLDFPQGVAFTQVDGKALLVVGEGHAITTWQYDSGSVSNPQTVVSDLPGGGHGAKGVAVDGDLIAYSLGSSSNRDPADRLAQPERAVIAEVRIDGSNPRVIATGVRNGFGLAFAPDGTLFTAVNQSDNQPYPFDDGSGLYGDVVTEFVNENPVDQVTRVSPGIDLGWPYCIPDTRGREDLRNLPYVADPEFNPTQEQLDCNSLPPVQLGLPAHSAPLGLAFTTGTPLAEQWGDGALVGAHGSWNRTPPRMPYIAFAAWDEGTEALGTLEMVVTGFQLEDGSRWGRAVAAIPGPDGALYVTDDAAGLVYRIAPPGV